MMQAMLFRGRAKTDRVESWVRDHYDSVWNFCRRRVGPTSAGDAAQETFLVAQRKGGDVPDAEIRAFLFGIGLRICQAQARRDRREMQLDWMDESSHSSAELGAIDRIALRAAMTKLSEEHRETVVLHELEGLTYDEIGKILGIPSGTVKSRLHHAFLHLRKQLMDRTEES